MTTLIIQMHDNGRIELGATSEGQADWENVLINKVRDLVIAHLEASGGKVKTNVEWTKDGKPQ
jgi:hypothetical protein